MTVVLSNSAVLPPTLHPLDLPSRAFSRRSVGRLRSGAGANDTQLAKLLTREEQGRQRKAPGQVTLKV